MISCWLTRKAVSAGASTGRPLPPRVLRHLAKCPACHDFQRLQCAVSSRLASEVQWERAAPPPFLAGKIMAAVKRMERPQRSPRAAFRLAWSGAAALVVAASVAAALLLRHSAPPIASAVRITPSPASLAGRPNAVSFPQGEQLLVMTRALDGPLEDEMRLMLADATNAVRLLASNFLPGAAK